MADLVLLLVFVAALLAWPAWNFLTRFAATRLARMPKPGELWRLSPSKTPWSSEREPYVHRVLDVRDGWVRYALLYNGKECEPDCCELAVFLRVFEREPEAAAIPSDERSA